MIDRKHGENPVGNKYLGSSDEERRSLMQRSRSGDMTVSNREVAEAFAIDPNYDPYDIPLDEVDPSHPALFLHGTHWPHLKRLREEDPVHYHEDSMFGPYWSVTKMDDIKYVDSHHEIFSSLQKKGGIALGGVPDREDQYALPMFIQEDPRRNTTSNGQGGLHRMFVPRASLQSWSL